MNGVLAVLSVRPRDGAGHPIYFLVAQGGRDFCQFCHGGDCAFFTTFSPFSPLYMGIGGTDKTDNSSLPLCTLEISHDIFHRLENHCSHNLSPQEK